MESDRVRFIGEDPAKVVGGHIAKMDLLKREIAEVEISFSDKEKSLRAQLAALSDDQRMARDSAMVRFETARDGYRSFVFGLKAEMEIPDGDWEFSPVVMSFVRTGESQPVSVPLDPSSESK
jgi:hypothetical protein